MLLLESCLACPCWRAPLQLRGGDGSVGAPGKVPDDQPSSVPGSCAGEGSLNAVLGKTGNDPEVLQVSSEVGPAVTTGRVLDDEPSSIPGNVTGEQILNAVLGKTGNDPKVLIVSSGTRWGGADAMCRVEQWCKRKHFEYSYYCTNPNDADHKKCDPEREPPARAIKAFLQKHSKELHKVVIFQQGHGGRTGSWWPNKDWQFSPQQLLGITRELNPAVTCESNVTVLTGCCFGGHWLLLFHGASAVAPSDKAPGDGHGGQFWSWLFENGRFPKATPFQRGLLSLENEQPHRRA